MRGGHGYLPIQTYMYMYLHTLKPHPYQANKPWIIIHVHVHVCTCSFLHYPLPTHSPLRLFYLPSPPLSLPPPPPPPLLLCFTWTLVWSSRNGVFSMMILSAWEVTTDRLSRDTRFRVVYVWINRSTDVSEACFLSLSFHGHNHRSIKLFYSSPHP